MAAFSARKAGVYLTSGTTTTAFTDEATTADTAKKVYTINAGAKRYWSPDDAITVNKNGTPVTTGFKIQYCGGKIIFDVALTNETVTVSGKYYTYAGWANAKEWDLDITYETNEATAFGGSGWKNKMGAMNEGSVTISKWWEDSTFLEDNLTRRMVLVLFVEETNATTHVGKRYECYGYLDSDSVKVAASGLIEEELKFAVDGQVFYSE